MMDCFAMWRRTRMVTLTAVCAAIYAAVLIPTQVFPLIPGSTNLRPGSAIAIVLSLLFGPAGAWGVAFGNTLNDLFARFEIALHDGLTQSLAHVCSERLPTERRVQSQGVNPIDHNVVWPPSTTRRVPVIKRA